MKHPISISINLDSLNEAYGFPKKFFDTTFHQVFKRIEKIAEKYNFPLTIFVIGKDLENEKNISRVKEWHEKGYEKEQGMKEGTKKGIHPGIAP